jgi:hypothetical protein
MLYGPDATVASVGIKTFEDQPEAMKAAVELGRNISARLKSK